MRSAPVVSIVVGAPPNPSTNSTQAVNAPSNKPPANIPEFAAFILSGLAELRGDIDKRFGDIYKRFGDIDKRFGDIDKRFGELRGEMSELRGDMGKGFADINTRLDELRGDRALKTLTAGAVQIEVSTGGPLVAICHGHLIDGYHVLTARHCVVRNGTFATSLRVTTLRSSPHARAQKIGIADLALPGALKGVLFAGSDVAVIRLAKRIRDVGVVPALVRVPQPLPLGSPVFTLTDSRATTDRPRDVAPWLLAVLHMNSNKHAQGPGRGGHSGAAVVDQYGRVLGMVSGAMGPASRDTKINNTSLEENHSLFFTHYR